METIFEYLKSRELITTLFVLFISFILCFVLRRFFAKSVNVINPDDKNSSRRKMLINMIEHVLLYFVFIVTILVVLQVNGINVTSLIASLGIVSAIVGLALQDWLKDIIMGINIVVDHFFDVTDIVEYNGIEGEVISFNVKTTKLRSVVDDSIITICNRNISQITVVSPIVNINVSFDYSVNQDEAMKLMKEICSSALQLQDVSGADYLGVQEYADSAVIHRMSVRCVSQNAKYNARRKINALIRTKFDESGLSIPFNQLDVHIK